MLDVFPLPQAPVQLHNTPATDLVTISTFENVLIMELLTFVVIFCFSNTALKYDFS